MFFFYYGYFFGTELVSFINEKNKKCVSTFIRGKIKNDLGCF